ncbi:anti-sigma factor family protein [Blastococcus sp. SYSU D00669]
MAELPGPRPPADDVLEIACQEFVELVTEHLEGTLPETLERAVADHLELCEPCRVYLEQMRATTAALRTVPAPTLPPAARDRLLDVFTALHGPDGDRRR